MCGIVGYIGEQNAPNVLVEGLKKLEYRGYDSSGIAVLENKNIQIRKSVGRLQELETVLQDHPIQGHVGLGHTRWATHGVPSTANAHPHLDSTGNVAVVHNGIIENYDRLKKKLIEQGIEFQSETDTEVIAQLIGFHLKPLLAESNGNVTKSFVKSVTMALKEIRGSYALGVICRLVPDTLVSARRDCPLILGVANGETFVASDAPAMIGHTRDMIYLEDGDLAILNHHKPEIYKDDSHLAKRTVVHVTWDPVQAEKGEFPHFMLKEIYEQPRIIKDTLAGRLENGKATLRDLALPKKMAENLSQIHIVACGTSWHAGLVGSYWMEKMAGLPCEVSVASEFRYRNPPLSKKDLVVAISQSGETADTLAAVRQAQKHGAHVVGISNVVSSTLVRESNGNLITHCGPEIGVASTKAFMGQLIGLNLLAMVLADLRKSYPEEDLLSLAKSLQDLPHKIESVLGRETHIKQIAKKYMDYPNFLYLGRHVNFPIALEGALKLKEISYIHAEGFAAGEMKHGPIALIDEQMPVVMIATRSHVYEKILSNMEEVRSRKGKLIAVATQGDNEIAKIASDVLYVPTMPDDLSPMVNVVPLQLLAYHMALLRGCDVDKPRNLAKSVTVE